MRIVLTSLVVAALAVVSFAGFGAPVATGDPAPALAGGGADDSFTMTVDPGKMDLNQGAKKDIKVSVKRGKNFKDKITVTFKTKEGVTVDPAKKELGGEDTSFNATVTAAKDAATGKHEVVIMGDGGGRAAKLTLDVNIKKSE